MARIHFDYSKVGAEAMAEFNLPGSSLEELSKIIQAYGHLVGKASGDDVGKIAGVHRTTVSRNSKFLVDVSILNPGAQKEATDLGKRLARALEHGVAEDISRAWHEAVSSNEKFSNIISTLRIKKSMSEKAFSDHILYVSGVKKTKVSETGARTALDVLVLAGLIQEESGNVTVATSPLRASEVSPAEPQVQEEEKLESTVSERVLATEERSVSFAPTVSVSPTPQVTINIQLQLPSVAEGDVYERLFKALADNLFPPKNV